MSPDGNRVAFASDRDTTRWDLYIKQVLLEEPLEELQVPLVEQGAQSQSVECHEVHEAQNELAHLEVQKVEELLLS